MKILGVQINLNRRATFARRPAITVAASLLVLLLSAVTVFGQAFTSGVTGTVSDSTGAVIPAATVTAVNLATGEERSTQSGANGDYVFSQLLPGNYEIRVESEGFKSFVQRNIRLLANQTAVVDAALVVGTLSEQIEVTAAPPMLDTQSADQTSVLENAALENLPINNRTPFHLVWINAGLSMPFDHSSATQDQNYNRFGMNGGRTETTLIMIDGVNASSSMGWNGLYYSPSVDSVQEMQVVRNSYDAEYGRSGGGVVSMVTKGGGADFHGTGFWYFRNSKLDANRWNINRAGNPKPYFGRNQFGGNMSGPIWKAKRLFFFGGYEGLRQGQPSTRETTVPTDLERMGDFSQTLNPNGSLSTIFDPFTTRPNPDGSGLIRDPFAGNVIPTSRFDTVGKNVMDLYPAPNRVGDPVTHVRNWFGSGKNVTRTDRYDMRVDWAASEKHTMYVRVSQAVRQDSNGQQYWGLGDTATYNPNPRNHQTFGYTYIPTPTWVVNILAGHGYWNEQRFPYEKAPGTVVGLPEDVVNNSQAPDYLPQFGMSGYATLGYNRYLENPLRTITGQANITKEMGKHSLKFGFSFESGYRSGYGWTRAPEFSFNRGMTSGPVASTNSSNSGSSLASLLLGTGSGGRARFAALNDRNRRYYAGYVQDAWRFNSRLTINLGLRYEVQRAPTDDYERYSNFAYNARSPLSDTTGLDLTGGLVWPDTSLAWDTNWKDFAPRIGIAYKLTDRLVVRAGYGLYFPPVLGGGTLTGFSNSTPWTTSQGGDGITPQDLLSDPFPTGYVPANGKSEGLMTNVGLGMSSVQRQHPTPYSQNYSFDIQYELGGGSIVEIGYSGVQGRRLAMGYGVNYNQLIPNFLSLGSDLNEKVPNPFYGQIQTGALAGETVPYHRLIREFPHFNSVGMDGETPGAFSSYNAFLAKFTKRFSQGLTVLVNYQFSKTIDNASERQAWEVQDGGPADAKKLVLERSLSAHDIPHSVTGTFVYELPVGQGRKFGSDMNSVANAIVGGWQISGMIRFQSGFPNNMRTQNTLGVYGFNHLRPDFVTDATAVKLDNRSPDRWFNTEAFTKPDAFTLGAAPRRIDELRQDGVHQADLALGKSFNIMEAVRMQFRAEFFNITNTPQFHRPNTTLGHRDFGRVTNTWNRPREIQFGLRLNF